MKGSQDHHVASPDLGERRRIDLLDVLHEQVIANDLRIIPADGGEGSDGRRCANKRHAQSADIGDEDGPLLFAGESLARHVVDDNAEKNRDADLGGEDKFGQDAPPHHIQACQFIGRFETLGGVNGIGVVVERQHLGPEHFLSLLPVLGAFYRPQRERIEEDRRNQGRAR